MALQKTAHSACSRKVHCVAKRYLDDPFASYFAKDTTIVNSPLMNRGTWLRTVAIERSILSFAESQCGGGPLQVISFGAGVDTLYFRLKKNNPNIKLAKYIELDFPDLVAEKNGIIQQTEMLRSFLGSEYALLSCDLRKIDELRSILLNSVEKGIPTVLLAEMVFVYLDESISTSILQVVLKDILDPNTTTLFISYDAIRPNDRFGNVMMNNLLSIGVNLLGIKDLPTPEAHEERCRKVGLEHVLAMSMKELYLTVPQETQKWLTKLEMVDDWDEWCIMHDHYCFVLASNKAEAVRAVF